MMLPTLLVVPGIYLKSDIAHRTSISGWKYWISIRTMDNPMAFAWFQAPTPLFRGTFPLLFLVWSSSLHECKNNRWRVRQGRDKLHPKQINSQLAGENSTEEMTVAVPESSGPLRVFKTYQRKFSPSVEAKDLLLLSRCATRVNVKGKRKHTEQCA